MDLDAIILATDPLARVRIAGLTACERAVRVARRVGATRVFTIDRAELARELAAWRADRACPLLVVRADQLVHTPLAAPLVAAMPREGVSIAVGPDDAYAGAFVASGATAIAAALGALTAGETDSAFVAHAPIATRVPHGEIARAPIATADERRAAHHLLYKLLVKPQDNAITRYLYRPVSFPLTRLLVWTPITPNQISYAVAALVALGCWITAHASLRMALLGTVVVLAASYLDCCDGEVARVKLQSSRFGAWIDTLVDELSSVGYMVALGWHCELAFGPQYFGAGAADLDPWKLAIATSVVTYLGAIYFVYYNIIVAVGSANSQDYVGRFVVEPTERPGTVRLVPAAPRAIAPARALPGWLDRVLQLAPYVVRRDFISWGAVVLAALGLTQVLFIGFVVVGAVTFVILAIDHVKLRSLRRSVARRGLNVDNSAPPFGGAAGRK